MDKASDIIKQFHDKKTEYSKFFYISWINFLKHCMKPWEEIEGVFRLAFEKVKDVMGSILNFITGFRQLIEKSCGKSMCTQLEVTVMI